MADNEISVPSQLTADELGDLTAAQLRKHLAKFDARIAELDDADATLTQLNEKIELGRYVAQVNGVIASIEAHKAEEKRLAEEAAAAVVEAAAPVAADPDPEPEVGSEDPTVDPEVEEAPVEDRVPVAAQLADVDPAPSHGGGQFLDQDTTAVVKPMLVTPVSPVAAAAEFDDEGRIGFDPSKYRPAQSADIGRAIASYRNLAGNHNVGSVDMLGGYQVPQASCSNTADENTAILRGLVEYPEPVAAILCGGVRTELDAVGDCDYRVDTPMWDSISRGVSAEACGFKWRKHIDIEAFKDGTSIWDACKQKNIDRCDEGTWKPVTVLPDDCEDDYCTADPFLVTWGLRIKTEDTYCRPEYIAEANQVLAYYRAKRLEEAAMFIVDKNSRHLGEPSAADPAVADGPIDATKYGLGISAVLPIIVTQALEKNGDTGRLICATSTLTAYVHEYFVKHVALDLTLSGQQGGQALALIRDVFAACGVNNVVVLRDFGCEGLLVDPWETHPEMICNFNCDTVDLAEYNCEDDNLGFGQGLEGLPSLSDSARIRLVDSSKFVKGSAQVFDYELRYDPASMRRNEGEYFGESRHFLFPTDKGDHTILDVKYCINGNRVDPNGQVDCGLFQAAPSMTLTLSEPGEFAPSCGGGECGDCAECTDEAKAWIAAQATASAVKA